MLNFNGMKIKISKHAPALITLISTLLVTTIIDIIVYKTTSDNKIDHESSIKLYANEHDGNKLHESLLNAAADVVKLTYPTASVNELVSIGFENDKLYFSAVASDEVTKLVLISLDSASSDIDSTLKYLANTNTPYSSSFMLNAKFYTEENLTSNMRDKLTAKYNLDNQSTYAYGKEISPSAKETIFASYVEGSTYWSVTNATFDSEGNIDESNAIKTKATRTENSYLYWLLFKICA